MRASRERCPECGEAIGRPQVRESSWGRELWPVGVAVLLVAAVVGMGVWGVKRHVRMKLAQWNENERVKEATEKALAAAGAGDAEEFTRQLEAGARLSPGVAGEELMSALANYRPRMAMLLLKAGADVRTSEGQAIADAAFRGYFFLVMRLAERGADVNVRGVGSSRAALHYCALGLEGADQLEVVRVLLERGADVKIRDDNGNTPLHLLSEPEQGSWDRVDCARLLVASGAEVNARNKAGRTALDLAREREREGLVEFLVSRGGR